VCSPLKESPWISIYIHHKMFWWRGELVILWNVKLSQIKGRAISVLYTLLLPSKSTIMLLNGFREFVFLQFLIFYLGTCFHHSKITFDIRGTSNMFGFFTVFTQSLWCYLFLSFSLHLSVSHSLICNSLDFRVLHLFLSWIAVAGCA